MVKELSLQYIKEFFKKNFNVKVQQAIKLDGYSSFVFKIITDTDKLYIFRQILSQESDPFKGLQDHAEKKLNKKYLYNKDMIQVEEFIVNVRLDIDKVFEKYYFTKLLRNVANINKSNKIIKKLPNLMFIIENNKNYIYDKIQKRIQQFNEPQKSQRQLLFKFAQKIYNDIMQEFQNEQEMVLCHNDLFYYNFLYQTNKDDFVIIDFEYAGYNPLGMDLMNLYNERVVDYDNLSIVLNKFPTQEEIQFHVRFYLYSYYYPEDAEKLLKNKNFLELLQKNENFNKIENQQIQNIINQFPIFGILLNLFWIFFYLQFPEADIDLDLDKFLNIKKKLTEKFYEEYKNIGDNQNFY